MDGFDNKLQATIVYYAGKLAAVHGTDHMAKVAEDAATAITNLFRESSGQLEPAKREFDDGDERVGAQDFQDQNKAAAEPDQPQ